MTTISTRHFRIRGRVQGVGFRYWTQQEAQRLGLNGWVCNRPDSSVEASATGREELLDEFERWLRHGPQGARVDQLESHNPDDADLSAQTSGAAGFEILR